MTHNSPSGCATTLPRTTGTGSSICCVWSLLRKVCATSHNAIPQNAAVITTKIAMAHPTRDVCNNGMVSAYRATRPPNALDATIITHNHDTYTHVGNNGTLAIQCMPTPMHAVPPNKIKNPVNVSPNIVARSTSSGGYTEYPNNVWALKNTKETNTTELTRTTKKVTTTA